MTIERAKRLAKQWANGYVCSLREGEAEEYHKLCFSALQEQQELESKLKVLESNDPLTVDELMEMAKEPVWTLGVSYTRDGTFSIWDIIESVNENGIHFGYSDEYVEWWNYGLKNMDGNLFGWLAYRRKPKEAQK